MTDHDAGSAEAADGLVFCERCRRRVPPEVRQLHLHGARSGVITAMSDEDFGEWDRRREQERLRSTIGGLTWREF